MAPSLERNGFSKNSRDISNILLELFYNSGGREGAGGEREEGGILRGVVFRVLDWISID